MMGKKVQVDAEYLGRLPMMGGKIVLANTVPAMTRTEM